MRTYPYDSKFNLSVPWGGNKSIPLESIKVPDSWMMVGLRIRANVTLTIDAGTTGGGGGSGGIAYLMDHQLTQLLSSQGLDLYYGESAQRPVPDKSFTVMRRRHRYAFGVDVQALAPDGTANIFVAGNRSGGSGAGAGPGDYAAYVDVIVPTGMQWSIRELVGTMGVGKTQAATFRGTAKRAALVRLDGQDGLGNWVPNTGLAIKQADATWTFEPILVRSLGADPWLYVQAYDEKKDATQTPKLDPMLFTWIGENQYPALTSPIGQYSLQVGTRLAFFERTVRDALDMRALIAVENGAGRLDGDVTPLYDVPPEVVAADLFAGPAQLTFKAAYFGATNGQSSLEWDGFPDVTDEVLHKDLEAARRAVGKPLHVVNAWAATGVKVPPHLFRFAPLFLEPEDARKHTLSYGHLHVPGDGQPITVQLPGTTQAQVRAHYQALKGSPKDQEDLVAQVLAAVPHGSTWQGFGNDTMHGRDVRTRIGG